MTSLWCYLTRRGTSGRLHGHADWANFFIGPHHPPALFQIPGYNRNESDASPSSSSAADDDGSMIGVVEKEMFASALLQQHRHTDRTGGCDFCGRPIATAAAVVCSLVRFVCYPGRLTTGTQGGERLRHNSVSKRSGRIIITYIPGDLDFKNNNRFDRNLDKINLTGYVK